MKTTAIITAFNEPRTIARAIESLQNQSKKPDEIWVSAPDEPTLNIARNYNINIFKDPGTGKANALNLLFKKINTDILILTDGDVYVGKNAVEEITKLFSDPKIGCVSGRPVPMENKDTKYGFWAHFLFDAAHNIRKKAFQNNSFIECSGYLFAFRAKEITEIPTEVSEDTVIPYYFQEKGYKIGYAEKARVYVKNVDNWKDWINQKTRTGKSHEKLDKYVDTKKTKKVKSFSTEAKGISLILKYPKTAKQLFWTIQLVFARFYMWMKVKSKPKTYQDAWKRVESTK